jgi:regulation of enolase protein 1 (concanavalin A-like superfamily)
MIAWNDGAWTHTPENVSHLDDGALLVTAKEGSDAWRHTAYGFVHDNAHALLSPLGVGEAMEVTFSAPWDGEFDQAGVYVHIDNERWIKTGVEFADGHLGLGAVVTDVRSDWSVGYVDDWHGREITVRVSRWADALIVRARADSDEWRLVRVAPFDGDASVSAGPFLAAPSRAGLTVRFLSWTRGAADTEMH